MKKSSFVLKALLATSLAVPMLASAESQLTVGAGTAAARLNFQVVIPRILFLAVGTGNALPLATDGTIDTVVFDYSTNPTAVGSGAPAAAISGNAVPVRVLGNNGQVEISAAGSGTGLTNVAGDIIPWTEITAASSEATFPVPAVGSTANPTLNAGRLTNRTATWTYSFANSAIAAPGSYTGQVTYTASMP